MVVLFDKGKVLEFINEEKVEDIVNYVTENKLEDPKIFQKLINLLTPDELVQFWNKIYDILDKSFKLISNCDDELNATPALAVSILGIFINFISFAIDFMDNAPVSLMEIILFCGEMLKYLDVEKEDLKAKIVSLCKKCYAKDLPIKNDIIAPAVIYWLHKSLVVPCNKAVKGYIKEIYSVKDSLRFIPRKETVDQAHFKKLLLDSVRSIFYFTFSEGRKVLACIFCVDETLIDQYHEIVKDLIGKSAAKDCQSYGDVYLMAWIEAGRECLEKVREDLEWKIQDIMDHAINISRHGNSLLPKLRKFISAFHIKRNDSMILKLLCKLYQPIIWRGLEHPLGYIRANSAQLLIDVFPLEDPDLRVVEAERELNKQRIILAKLLVDDCPWVRCVTAIGVCNILAFQRELISQGMVTEYLLRLAEDLAADYSMTAVRISVIKGMKILLQNHFPVPILKTVLTKISFLYYDPSEKVKLCFCNFLLDIKKHPSIKYWEIVSVNDLLDDMASGRPQIQKLIIQLMHNSYIPVEQPEICWLDRCVDLINQNFEASRIFFLHVTEIVGLQVAVKFIQFIYRALSLFVRMKIQQRESENYSYRVPGPQKESDEKNLMKLLEAEGNNDVLIGIVVAAYSMFRSILFDLEKPKNKKLYKSLISKISKRMPALLNYFQEEKGIWEPLFAMCSYIPSSLLPDFSDTCYIKLQALSGDEKPGEYKTLLECLCNVGKGFELLKYIQMGFQAGLQSSQNRPKIRGKRSVKAPDFCFEPAQAAQYLMTALTYRNPRVIILSQNLEQVKDFLSNMELLQKIIEDSRNTLADESKKMFLFRGFSALVTIAIHMHRPNKHSFKVIDTDSYLRKLLKWVTSTFLSKPVYFTTSDQHSESSGPEPSTTEHWKDLGYSICKDVLGYIYIAVTAKILEKPATDYMDFLKNVMQSEYGPCLANACINIVFGLSQYCRLLSAPVDLQKENQKLILPMFAMIIELLYQDSFYEHLSSKGKNEALTLKFLMLSQVTVASEALNVLGNFTSLILNKNLSGIMPILSDYQAYKDVVFPESNLILTSTISTNLLLLRSFFNSIEDVCQDKGLPDVCAASIIVARTISENTNNARKVTEHVQKMYHALKGKLKSVPMVEENKQHLLLMESSLHHINNVVFKEVKSKAKSNKKVATEDESCPVEDGTNEGNRADEIEE